MVRSKVGPDYRQASSIKLSTSFNQASCISNQKCPYRILVPSKSATTCLSKAVIPFLSFQTKLTRISSHQTSYYLRAASSQERREGIISLARGGGEGGLPTFFCLEFAYRGKRARQYFKLTQISIVHCLLLISIFGLN